MGIRVELFNLIKHMEKMYHPIIGLMLKINNIHIVT